MFLNPENSDKEKNFAKTSAKNTKKNYVLPNLNLFVGITYIQAVDAICVKFASHATFIIYFFNIKLLSYFFSFSIFLQPYIIFF